MADVRLGAGGTQDTDLDVQLTTVPGTYTPTTYASLFPGTRGFLGDLQATVSYVTTPTTPYTITTLSLTKPIGSAPPTFTYYYVVLYSATVQRLTLTYRLLADGALPAIDYGDGVTLPAATLPYSPALSGGGRRVFRGSFTHSYATPGSYLVRVASAPNPATTIYTGSAVAATTYPFGVSYQLLVGGRFGFASALFATVRVITSPTFTTSLLGSTFLPTPGTTTLSSLYLYFFGFTDTITTGPAQLVNSVLVGALGAPEIPAASTLGLLVLASLLATAGALLLRR